jgi:hypothetical protein
MDSRDNFGEQFEALEQQTEQLKHQTQALEAHTRSVERRLRWWRGIACGLGLLQCSKYRESFLAHIGTQKLPRIITFYGISSRSMIFAYS